MRKHLVFFAFVLVCWPMHSQAEPPLVLPAQTASILHATYSGRLDQAISESVELQKKQPQHPLGYLLEAEARWWRIYCSSAEYKYGMTMARHHVKGSEDDKYLELSSKALSLAEASLQGNETAEMHLYAGMANAMAARLYGLRWEGRSTARVGVRAREHLLRAQAMDPTLADADMGLGLYDYYVDTLSAAARVLRFFMGIPGGSKQDGIRLLQNAIEHGQLTRADARFYLAIDLHNYDQKYEEALAVIEPLGKQYPENPIFELSIGDLYGKLGRKTQAGTAYRAASHGSLGDPECDRHIQDLVQASLAALQN